MIKRLLAWLAVLPLGMASAASYPDLGSAYAALKFDPRSPGNVVAVLFSDPHMNVNPAAFTTNLHPLLVDEVNHMDPPPARILISGDLTTTYSGVPGFVAKGDWYKDGMTNEAQLWLQAVKAFTNIAPEKVLWVPGNHDQLHTETNADLFCSLLSCPPHHVFDLGGIRFLMFNGGNYADASEPEKKWLLEQVASSSPTQVVAVIVHQPPFNGTASDRGNALFLRAAFSNWPSRWYVFAGHAHSQEIQVVNIGRSNVAAYFTGTTSTNAFGGLSMNAGFRLLCLSNGLAGTLYYHFQTHAYEVEPQPNWSYPRTYIAPFETVKGLLWRRLKMLGTPPEVEEVSATDSIEWYAYPTNLVLRVSLGLHQNAATHFLLLNQGLDPASTLDFSTDRTNWIRSATPVYKDSITTCVIPEEMRSNPTIYARFQCYPGPNNFIAGWGLSTTNPPPYASYPQFGAIPELETRAGNLFRFTNVAIHPYAPPDKLTFRLLGGPDGAEINPETGVLTWCSPSNASGQAFFSVQVADQGTPVMSATQQFTVAIRQPWPSFLSEADWYDGNYRFKVTGRTGIVYNVWASTNLVNWTLLLRTNSPSIPFEFSDSESGQLPQRFYRVGVEPPDE